MLKAIRICFGMFVFDLFVFVLEFHAGHAEIYQKMEKRCQLVTIIYYRFLTLAMIGGMTLPLLVVVFNYLRGTLTPDIWYIPMPGTYFYDFTTSPGFELTYLWQTVTLVGIMRSYGAIDSLFMGMCIHIGAGYRDVCATVIDIDQKAAGQAMKWLHASTDIGFDRRLRQKLNKCVDLFADIDG